MYSLVVLILQSLLAKRSRFTQAKTPNHGNEVGQEVSSILDYDASELVILQKHIHFVAHILRHQSPHVLFALSRLPGVGVGVDILQEVDNVSSTFGVQVEIFQGSVKFIQGKHLERLDIILLSENIELCMGEEDVMIDLG